MAAMSDDEFRALPMTLTMQHVGQLLGLSRAKTYELPHRKGFPAIRFGRAIRVPREALIRWLQEQAAGGASPCMMR